MFDLTDAFAGQADALADFFERQGVFAIEAISHLEDLKNEGYDVLSREFREKSKIAIERITVDEVYEIAKKVLRI